jgi:hypothetical protein
MCPLLREGFKEVIMPHIVLIRSDIQEGSLNILDLKPNTSLKNLAYDPKGQTRYGYRPANEAIATSGTGPIITRLQYEGLAAYLIDRVQAGTGAALTADEANTAANDIIAAIGGALTITDINTLLGAVVPGTELEGAAATPATGTMIVTGPTSPGDSLVLNGTLLTRTGGPRTSGGDDFDGTLSGAALITEIAAAINDPANSFSAGLIAVANGTTLELAAAVPGTAGNSYTLSANEFTGGTYVFSAGTLLGGADAIASSGSVADVMRLISGDRYVLPKGSVVDTDGSTFDPTESGAFEGGESKVDVSGFFNISLNDSKGYLFNLKSSDYTYLGVAGAAIVVYDEEGNVL